MPNDAPPHIGALLRMAWEHLQIELYDGIRDAGFAELSRVQHPLMRYPPVDGLRPGQIATRLNLSKQAVNDLLREFEGLGLLSLERDRRDGRARTVRYTERGWACYEAASAASRRIGERWAAEIGEAQYRGFVDGLDAILALYDQS